MPIPIPHDEKRTIDQLKEHYELEKKLSNRLRNSKKEERQHLYADVYDELFNTISHHPQLTDKKDPQHKMTVVKKKMRIFKKYLKSDTQFLELGPGDCLLSFEVSKFVQKAIAVDVSKEITHCQTPPNNFELVLSDGSSVPIPENTIHVAYSNHLMEHLHVDDAFIQLKNIYHALAPKGKYACITPNQLSGPHDISRYFDDEATGFHMKEYRYIELCRIFKEVGFSRIISFIGGKGYYMRFPGFLIAAAEKFLECLPVKPQKWLANTLLFRALLGVMIMGEK